MTRRFGLLIVALLAWLPESGSASHEEGAVAPPGRWYVEGGCASGSSASSTRPVLEDLGTAWRLDVEGEIESEPLVWDDWILVTTRLSPSKRSLRFYSVIDGRAVTRPRILESPVSLRPSLWHDVVLVRSGEKTLQAFRKRASSLVSIWKYESGHPLGPPLLFEDEVYVGSTKELLRLTVDKPYPIWTVKGNFRGRPRLRGSSIYALDYRAGLAHALELDRPTGAVRSEPMCGHHRNRIPTSDGSTELSVFERDWVILHDLPVPTEAAGDVRGVWLTRGDGADATWNLCSYLDFERPPVAWADHWTALTRTPTRAREWIQILDSDSGEYVTLAGEELHAELLEVGSPPSRSGKVVYMGSWIVDSESLRLLRRLPLDPIFRVVPARECLLVVDTPSSLQALREASREQGPPWLKDSFQEGLTSKTTAVYRDGTQRTAVHRVRMTENSWEIDQDRELVYLETREGRPLYAPTAEDAVRAIDRINRARLSEGYGDLVEEAVRSKSRSLAERLLREGWRRGADEKRLAKSRTMFDRLKPGARVREDRVAKVLEQERTLRLLPAESFWTRAQSLGPQPPLSVRIRLMKESLQRGRPLSRCLPEIRKLLPLNIQYDPDTPPEDWLDLAETLSQSAVTVLDSPASPPKTPAELELTKARKSWRPDLIALENRQLLVLTPLARPGAVARCLALGEIVCRALESIFGGERKLGNERDHLRLCLYENEDEYNRESLRASAHLGSALAWSAGHYDMEADITRVYLPEGDDGFETLMSVYAHELTHHWIRKRCPLFDSEEAATLDARTPGFWIVEGFATLVQEFLFDLEDGTWNSRNPRAGSLDVLANIRPEHLIPWPLLFSLSQESFSVLDDEPTRVIPMTFHLGYSMRASARRLFYDQSAAVCHFLFHAEEGRYRAKLLDYLSDHYLDQRHQMDIEKVFGMSAESLGEAVVAFAKESIAQSQ